MIYLLPITAAPFIVIIVLLLIRIKSCTASLENEVRQRENTEARLVHLNSVLRAVRNVNQLITHERNMQTLLQQTCGYLTERRSYFNVWLLLLDEEGRFKDAFESGIGKPFEKMKERMQKGNYTDCIRKTLSSEDIIIKKDHMNTCTDCPLKHSHKQRGSMSIRITYQDRIFAVLTVSVHNRFLEEEDEHELLQELAGDIGFPLHDIEVSQNKEELQEAQQRTAIIVENSPIVLFRWKAEEGWPVLFVSENVNRFGYTQEDFLSGTVQYPDIIYPEDLQRVADEVRRYLESGANRFTQQYRIYSAAGTVHWIEDHTTIERDSKGNATAFEGVIYDITEQKKNERELRFRSMLLNQIQDKITATDLEGRITYINDAECIALGRTREQIVGDYVYSYGEDPSRGATQREIIENTIRDGEWRGEVVNYDTKGNAIILDSRIQVVHDETGKPMSLVHQKLYQTKDLSNINITDYIQELSKILLNSFLKPTDEISIRYNMEEVNTLIDIAVPLGLVVNEILMNCIKHAFPENGKGEITVTLRQKNAETLVLTIADNGVGLPEGLDIAHSETVGFQIIYNVIRTQLNGTVSVENNHGTRWNIVIGETGYRERV